MTDAGPALRYVAIGDSYTIGTSVAAHDAWPAQLVARLAVDPPRTSLALVANHAVNGSSADSVVRRQLPLVAAERQLGFASLLVGANDAVQGVPEAVYRADVTTILNTLLGRLRSGSHPGRRDARLHGDADGGGVRRPGDPAGGDRSLQRGVRRSCAASAGSVSSTGSSRSRRRPRSTRPSSPATGCTRPAAQYARWVSERIEPAVRELLGRA